MIKQYEKLRQFGIKFSESITDTYNELVTTEEISRDRFNYLVGKLSTTMDSVAPRASIANEIKKKINGDIKSNNSLKDFKKLHNDDAFVDGLWEGAEYTPKSNVEKSQLENVENNDDSGIIKKEKVLTLDDLTRDVLRTKPPNSRVPKDWIMAGGSISIDKNGNWIYTDWFGTSVKYIDGYPDYNGAGAVVQEVDIGDFISRGIDRRKANMMAPNGPCSRGNIWHHSQDGRTMQEVDVEIHRRFTHRGGYSLKKERNKLYGIYKKWFINNRTIKGSRRKIRT